MIPRVKNSKPVSVRVPKFRVHPNGQAFVEHRSIPTRSHRIYLGKADSPEAQKKYGEVIAQILAGGYAPPADTGAGFDIAISEAVLLYLDYAESYYCQGGRRTKEFGNIVQALKVLSAMFGTMKARDFGPRALLTYRQNLIQAGHARNHINAQVGRVKRFFRWCCSNERLPPDMYHRLACVAGLQRGRSEAKETAPVKPVSKAAVQAVLPHLPPTIAAMVQVQYLCGMRPEEVTIMRGCDLRTGGPIWLYAPSQHKSAWRGHTLVKAVPQAAQDILRPYLRTDLQAYLFNPREAETARTGRVVREQVRDHYDTYTYRRAITRACEIAFGMPAHLRRLSTRLKPAERDSAREQAAAWRAEHCWSPNQLRHAIATEISQTMGQQAAQRWLGHMDLSTTSIYAERETAELIAIAQELDRRWAS